MQTEVRHPAVAGTFYPADPAVLHRDVQRLLDDARPHRDEPPPKALIAPHAGYVYSGPVAASAYARIAPLRGRVHTVVLLGPTHRVPVRGVALPGATRFETPLGSIDVDTEAVRAIADLPQVVVSPEAHALEHSLEVHLPFLQETLGDFRLLPLAVGDASPTAVAEVLERVWGDEHTLVVVSSDLSHYLPYDVARRTDQQTVREVLALAADIDHAHACGATPVNALTLVARRRGLRLELLDLRNSGDTAGDRRQVVGYASIAAYADGGTTAKNATDDRGDTLLRIARATIARQLGLSLTAREDSPFLRVHGASFVTLTREGALRGCIGSLEAHRPLVDDVKNNARSAAFLDPRFRPLSLREFDGIRVEVSVLSAQEPVAFSSEPELLSRLRPGVDGLVLEYAGHRGTFLPQVWDSLPDPAAFLGHLKRKAGLPADFWASDVRVSRYTVEKWCETD
ncbi:MAG: AmmeMemoRadiSam system protein B [Betaproteobacteria bacterium]|nr:AmmeMemoRadiSam system protein B [Betaproteobacteria bacterium]